MMLKNKLFGKLNFHEKYLANTYLGIDIGYSDVRYVYLYRLKDKFEIISYGLEKFPSVSSDRQGAIRMALRNLFTRRKIKATQIVLSVYGPEISSRIITLPAMPEKELKAAVFLQNRTEIAYFNEDTPWDYRILSTEKVDGKDVHKILVIVANNDALTGYLESLAQMGIRPSLIIPKPMAHEGAFRQMVSTDEPSLLIDISDDTTLFCCFKNGQVWYVRNIAAGGEQIRKGLEKEIEKNTIAVKKKLADMGKEPVITDKMKEKIRELSTKTNPMLDVFVGEVNRTMMYIRNEFSIQQLRYVFVCGRGSADENILNRIRETLQADVEYLFPIFKPVYKVQDYVDFVSPFGAALYITDQFNLIPAGYKESWRFNYYLRWAYFAGLAVFLTIGILSFQAYSEYRITKSSFEKEQNTYQSLKPRFEEYEKAEKQLEASWKNYKSFLEKMGADYYPLVALAAVSNAIPEGLMVTEFFYERKADQDFSFEMKREISVKGETYKNENLWDSLLPAFVESLKNSGVFEKVVLEQQSFSVEEKKGLFTLKLVINEEKQDGKKRSGK